MHACMRVLACRAPLTGTRMHGCWRCSARCVQLPGMVVENCTEFVQSTRNAIKEMTMLGGLDAMIPAGGNSIGNMANNMR